MLKTRGELNLAREPVDADGPGNFWRENLDHDLATELAILGEEDATHPAAPQLTDNLVAGAEYSLECPARCVQSLLVGRKTSKRYGRSSGVATVPSPWF